MKAPDLWAFPAGEYEGGMYLRDYFAGQALAAMAGVESPAKVAEACYAYADAMLAHAGKARGGAHAQT